MSSNQGISRKPVGSDGPPLSPDPQLPPKAILLSGSNGGIHWRASTIMVTSLISGMLLALGHHLFYNHLDGKVVGTDEHVIKGVTPQQLNLTIGTLFAFLVHAFLSVAVTTSYTQIVWRAIKKRATTLSAIDTLFHVVSNFWSLIFLSTWWKYPILFLVGLTIWLIPIASVITPAALTVTVAAVNPVHTEMTRVPRVDFTSLNFANIASGLSSFLYLSPRYAVVKIAAATAAQGAILPIAPPAANSSWALDFAGPSIKCANVQGPLLDDIKANIQAVLAIELCATSFGYIAWTPSYVLPPSNQEGEDYVLSTLPFLLSQNKTSYSLNGGSLGPLPEFVNGSTSVPATFYAGTFYNMTNQDGYDGEPCSTSQFNNNPPPNITVLQCMLYNSSYHVNFSYVDGAQTINITLDESPYNPVTSISNLNSTYPWGPLADYTPNGTVISYKPAYVENLAYQSVMGAFGQIVVGTIWNSDDTWGLPVSSSTSVMSTVLGETKELAWLNNYPEKVAYLDATLQQTISDPTEGKEMWNGVDVVDDLESGTPLKDALEALFQNITVGLMSSRLLQPNISSPYAPPPTNVTMPSFQTVYSYSHSRLWIAYGLAILLAIISVLIGLSSMLSSGIAYTNHFSTILRAARYANMETSLMPEDADGKDPLPKYLTTAIVSFEDWGRREKRGISWFSDTKSSGVSSRLLSD